jgi:hypothetical protein|uniref:Uncharacterized protein n=2 Tax=Zea mays TaxID=4577 RepID=A0A804PXU1_MAIZE
MEGAMAGSTSLSMPETKVNILMQQVADDYGLEVFVGLPQATTHAIPAAKDKEKVYEYDLSCRLAELKVYDWEGLSVFSGDDRFILAPAHLACALLWLPSNVVEELLV